MEENYTTKQKAANWWHYHWLWVVAGVVFAILALHMLWSSVHAPKWDLQVAVIVKEPFPSQVLEALSDALSDYTTDLNNDGVNRVEVIQYVVNFRTDEGKIDPKTQSGGVAAMMADLRECYSQVFLLDDPDGFSISTGALRYRNGDLPEDDVYPLKEETCYLWTDCPELMQLQLGSYDAELYGGSGDVKTELSHLYIGSRGFWDGTATEHPECDEALWHALTENAKEN